MSNVFVYGTLLSEEVVSALIRRVPRKEHARIRGYRRHAVRDRVYPAIVPAGETDEVKGLVLYDLNTEEMGDFNYFEGEEYYKVQVSPILENGDQVEASVYVWEEGARHLLYGEWDYEEWRRQHLREYLEMCFGFKEELELTKGSRDGPSNPPEPVEGTR